MAQSARSYDAEQTTVQALVFGERGSRHKRRPWRYGGGAHPCAPPRFGVAFTEFADLLTYKTSRSCDTAS
ncbi:hypothetical protein [Desulfosporosinus sp. FKA]|uniref:hypothetical protein n=1 Tax=Desulfosporosinus sp. FKA TaxID=1969834 RepID=UPI0011250675|nr:hypothetical protein [Desulfosporosinus sp. FKA]